MTPHLRLFRPQEDTDLTCTAEATVPVRLSELLPIVAMAQKMKMTWLNDFLDDEVRISDDLNEVLLSFGRSRPRAS